MRLKSWNKKMIRLVYSFAHLSSKSEYKLALIFWSVLLLITTFCGRVPTYLQVVTKQKGVCDNQEAHDIKPSYSQAQGSTSFPLFFSHFLISCKGIVPQTFFFRPNLLYWIVMGCGQYPFTLSLLVSLTNSVCMCIITWIWTYYCFFGPQ